MQAMSYANTSCDVMDIFIAGATGQGCWSKDKKEHIISLRPRADSTEMENAHGSRANDDCENSNMLNGKAQSTNQPEIGARNDPIGSHQAIKLLACAGAVLAGVYALRSLDRRLSANACLAARQNALRDSTSERRSAARWENEGGTMLTDHCGDSVPPESLNCRPRHGK